MMPLKSIDRICGGIICGLLPRPRPDRYNEISNILVIRPGGIGDAVMLATALNLLKKHCSQTRITVLAEKRNEAVFQLTPSADEVLCYDRPRDFLKALRGKYDAVVDTEQWYRLSAVAARLIRSPIKIGFGTNQRRLMFTHEIIYDHSAYEVDNFLALLKPLGVIIDQEAETVSLSVPPLSMAKAAKLLQSIGSDPFVVIFPGASIQEKRWGAERFSLVAKRLSVDGYRVVVVGGRQEFSAGDKIVMAGGLNLAGRTTLAETAALISCSALVVCGDSGVLHIAAGLGVPTVSLFGPSSSAKWAPRGERHIVIEHHPPCSPCSSYGTIPPCTIESRCIKDITPDEVLDAIRRLFSPSSSQSEP